MSAHVWLIVTVGLQIVVAILALRIGRETGRRGPWRLVAAAMLGLAIRPVLLLVAAVSAREIPLIEVAGEAAILVAALLLAAGLLAMVVRNRPKRSPEGMVQGLELLARALVENAPLGIVYVDANGVVVYTNPACDGMMNLTPGRRSPAIGRRFVDLPSIRRDPDIARRFERLIQGEPFPLIEMDYESLLGTRLRLVVTGTPHFGPDGRLMGAVIMHADVTDRSRAEAERNRLAGAVQQAGEGIAITDLDGIIEYVNPAFERITGYPASEAIGRTPRILRSGAHDEAFYRGLWQTLKRGDVWSGRLTNRRRDGSTFEAEGTISPIRDEAGKITHYVEVLHDITDHVALEEQLRQSQKMEAVGRLAGGVAHDFNNVLTAILGNVDLAKRSLDRPTSTAEFLLEIEQCAGSAAQLTRQLLTFSRRQVIRPEVIKLNDTLERMKGMLRRLIDEDVRLSFDQEDDLGQVRVDAGQVEQVILNLAVNAREAMPGGGELIVSTRNMRLDEAYTATRPDVKPGPYVVLSVSDTGCGIPKDTIRRIFEPFFTTKPSGRGTGLGLSIVFGIVKQAGGHVAVYSEPGVGTTFHVYLPRVDIDAAAEAAAAEASVPRGTETILLAEDDEVVRALAGRMLTECGYRVLIGESGRHALDVARSASESIHLLVTDVIMPDLDGVRLAASMRAVDPELKVLYMSGHPAEVIADRGIRRDGVAFLQKPFTLEALAGRVRAVLDGTVPSPT